MFDLSDIDSLSLDVPSLQSSVQLDSYRQDPSKWIEDKLSEFIWSKQKEILSSVCNNRKTAVHSCHRIGKSFIGARLAIWWIDTHAPGDAFVVTSAHSGSQVKVALWREIGRAHAKGKFPGRVNQTEWHMIMPAGNEEMVAIGRKPADEDPSAFQGMYSRYVLVILDEACYVPKTLWGGVNTLISNEDSRVIAFGNPDDINTEFGEVCKPGSDWNVIGIGYGETPNFTNEIVPDSVRSMLIGSTWVDEVEKNEGVSSPYYISKVLGKFPETSIDGLIPINCIKEAQKRSLQPGLPVHLGIDVGGGGDKNVIAQRNGRVVRIVLEDYNPDTMQTLSNTLNWTEKSGAELAKIDDIGIGRGARDRAKEIAEDQQVKRETPGRAKLASKVVGINVGESAEDNEHFVNKKAENYWSLRERFIEGTIDIDEDDKELADQLSNLKYKRSAGRIQIESKIDYKKRTGKGSPDKAEAVMLAFAKAKLKKKAKLTW